MKNFLLVIISSVASGIIVAVFGYLFLTTGPETPSIDVYQTTLDIPLDAGSSLLDDGNSKNSSGYIVQKFTISNYGAKIYPNLNIKPDGFKKVVLEQGGKTEVLFDHQGKDYTIVPGESIRVFGISDGYSYSYGMVGDGRIQVSVGQDPIATRSQQTDDAEPLTGAGKFFRNYPFIGFLLVAGIGLGGVLFWIAVAFVGTTQKFFPTYYAKWTGDTEHGRNLALLNWLQREDAERFDVIETMAAKYAKEHKLLAARKAVVQVQPE
ncbi:hypothetical protein ACFX5Q_15105 [Mesorhizobium sp. IMUNJ 23033]|uniref:hypothetical protein n=1 Tax=Mesorhizobium sp. IMUNJ 23033 TaxID=3378039 RepID=UPI0038516136